jgi:hypothetical protein
MILGRVHFIHSIKQRTPLAGIDSGHVFFQLLDCLSQNLKRRLTQFGPFVFGYRRFALVPFGGLRDS